ncbi:MAG: hypothetical protein ACRDTH_01830 [Pseudonocardiaceae bacterium]
MSIAGIFAMGGDCGHKDRHDDKGKGHKKDGYSYGGYYGGKYKYRRHYGYYSGYNYHGGYKSYYHRSGLLGIL